MSTIRQERLSNGLQIVFTDESNRYFGDYHRVCVVAAIVCDFAALAGAIDAELRSQAVALYGERLVVEKRMERMGVASRDVDTMRLALVDNFMRQAPYLGRPDYPRMLVAAELKKQKTTRFYG